MILVDAGVLIAYLRTKDAKLNGLFRSLPLAVCGVTRAEILAGARSDQDCHRLVTFLGAFQQMPITDSLWDRVGATLASLLASGITVPFPDAVLATIAIDGQMEVWAHDPHFPLMQTFLPKLQLYQEPP